MLAIIVQASVTQVELDGHIVEIRQDGARHVATIGRKVHGFPGRRPQFFSSYHDARAYAVAKVQQMAAPAANDGLLFEVA